MLLVTYDAQASLKTRPFITYIYGIMFLMVKKLCWNNDKTSLNQDSDGWVFLEVAHSHPLCSDVISSYKFLWPLFISVYAERAFLKYSQILIKWLKVRKDFVNYVI